MAELPNKNHQFKGKRPIKKSTSVDLTPMVDLGFLLITFFVFTTTMATNTAMAMVTPKEDPKTTDDICESCVITILPAASNQLYYYEGFNKNNIYKTISYSPTGLRTLLVNKKNRVAAINREAVLIIKPGASSTFKNLISIIDESSICNYKRYYLDKPTAAEERAMQLQKF